MGILLYVSADNIHRVIARAVVNRNDLCIPSPLGHVGEHFVQSGADTCAFVISGNDDAVALRSVVSRRVYAHVLRREPGRGGCCEASCVRRSVLSIALAGLYHLHPGGLLCCGRLVGGFAQAISAHRTCFRQSPYCTIRVREVVPVLEPELACTTTV